MITNAKCFFRENAEEAKKRAPHIQFSLSVFLLNTQKETWEKQAVFFDAHSAPRRSDSPEMVFFWHLIYVVLKFHIMAI